MARLSPKQLAQATATTGDPLTWNGREWAPDEALRLAVETQRELIGLLIQTLQNERIDLPSELEEYTCQS